MRAHECVRCTRSHVHLCSEALKCWLDWTSWISVSTDPSEEFRACILVFYLWFLWLLTLSICLLISPYNSHSILFLSGNFWLLRALGLGYFGYISALYFLSLLQLAGSAFSWSHTLFFCERRWPPLYFSPLSSWVLTVFLIIADTVWESKTILRCGSLTRELEPFFTGSKVCLGREEKEKDSNRLFKGEESDM